MNENDLALEIFLFLEQSGGCKLGELKERFKEREEQLAIDIMSFVNNLVKRGTVLEIEYVIPLDQDQTIFKTGSFFLPGHARLL